MVAAIASSVDARASDATPVPRDAVEGDLRGYYEGERVAAYVIGGMGAAAAAGGGFLVTRDDDFARGLGGAWVVMGGLETLGAIFYAFQVGAELDHFERSLANDPTAFRAEELDHIRGTSSRFVVYRAVELSLALAGAGVATYGVATHRGAWSGAGTGVASLALPFFVIDSINDVRASRYLDEVRRFEPALGVQSLAADRGWVLSMSGRF
jgi:hypothetical protein